MVDGKPVCFTVIYDANGGYNVPEAQEKILRQPLILSGEIPARDGYFFVGWAEQPDSETGFFYPGNTYEEDSDLILYAIWKTPDFVLPSSLQTVEESAFENGVFEFVLIPENVNKIGSRAFAACSNLKFICFNGNEIVVPESAFDNISTDLIVLGHSGSSAEVFAKTNGYRFIKLPE